MSTEFKGLVQQAIARAEPAMTIIDSRVFTSFDDAYVVLEDGQVWWTLTRERSNVTVAVARCPDVEERFEAAFVEEVCLGHVFEESDGYPQQTLERAMERLFRLRPKIHDCFGSTWTDVRRRLREIQARWQDDLLNGSARIGEVDFSRLYLVRDPLSKRAMRGAPATPAGGDPFDLFTGSWVPRAPVLIRTGKRGPLMPILWTGEPAIVLFAAPLIEAMKRAGLTGWATYPVQLAMHADPHYEGISVVGRCGRIDWTRSDWVRVPGDRESLLRGFYFDELSWDGSDVFSPQGSMFLCVTEHARACLAPHVGRSCRFDRLSEILTPQIVVTHTSPFCPACGCLLSEAAWKGDNPSNKICPSCGILFGYDDVAGGDVERRQTVYVTWRERWVAHGAHWCSSTSSPPAGWDPHEQLARVLPRTPPGY